MTENVSRRIQESSSAFLASSKCLSFFCFQVASESRLVSSRIALWARLEDEFLTDSPVQLRNSQSERR